MADWFSPDLRAKIAAFWSERWITPPEGFLQSPWQDMPQDLPQDLEEGINEVEETMESLVDKIKSRPDFDPMVFIRMLVAEAPSDDWQTDDLDGEQVATPEDAIPPVV